ncbi:transposable element Tcb2 transposase [Histoplasma capsulatum G186AR]|uniref:Transposable element Tcb2 transposase n=1 Tax=Ajellomyces capsulatus TaxID=5037 RepID=A0A8H7YJP4_AJECA|nr:transposable element Tcb2 transposase [Histoplasma capsulatum]QSS72641.1 transposable element Tcb2 transposase [Histoplasma capsulatum G186AR]
MPSKPKTLWREHSPAIINTILNLRKWEHSFLDIARILELPCSTISSIVYHESHQIDEGSPKKCPGRSPKLSACDQCHLILSVEKNPFHSLASFLTFSKSGFYIC